ncbi:MAG TPA: O-antigen ligase family protein [Armatimonadota bacterium]|nr:O-antigen ligase family protein [Armatimonadota bacterium]
MRRIAQVCIAGALAAYYLVPGTTCTYRSLHNVLPAVDVMLHPLRAGLVAFAVFVLIMLAYVRRVRGSQAPEGLWIGAFALVVAITAPYLFGASSVVELRCLMAVIPFGVGLAAARLYDGSPATFGCLALLGAVQSGIAVVGFARGDMVDVGGGLARASGSFADPGTLYPVLAVAAVAALWLACSARRTQAFALWTFCSAVLLTGLLLTWSRVGVLSVAAGLAALGVSTLPARKAVAQAALPLALLICVVFLHAGAPDGMAMQPDLVGDTPTHWRVGVRTFRTHWMTGVGAGRIPRWAPQKPGRQEEGGTGGLDPHSEPLLWMDEFGIGGLLLLLFAFVDAAHALRSSRTGIGAPTLAAWAVLGVVALFRGVLLYSPNPAEPFLVGVLLGTTLLVGGESSDTGDGIAPGPASTNGVPVKQPASEAGLVSTR